MNTFLPKDYTQPKDFGPYMKLEKGENRFRVMSSAVTGWEYWTTANKPVRSKTELTEAPADAKVDENGRFQKHFWAFVVYNYEAKKPQILEVTQKTIMQFIGSYVDNAKWGDPKGYDLVITRTGEGLETEYTVIAEPHTKSPEADISKIDLEALFEGADPFSQAKEVEYPVNDKDQPF